MQNTIVTKEKQPRMTMSRDLSSLSSFATKKKTLRNDDKLGGSSLSFVIEEKKPRMMMSQEPSSLSSFTIEEKNKKTMMN
jgi:hypothetical protein